MNKDIEQKIAKLREVYTGEINRKDIDDIEKSLRERIKRSQIAEIDVIQDILKDAQQKVDQINYLLAYDESIDDSKRKALFRERDVWQFNLDRYGMGDSVGAIKDIENLIDQKLES